MLVRSHKQVAPLSYGEGIQKRVLIGPKQGALNFVLRLFELSPGKASSYHRHDWEHEVFVLSGEGVVTSEAGTTPLRANDAIYVAPNEMHSFANAGQDNFRFICVVPLRGEDTP